MILITNFHDIFKSGDGKPNKDFKKTKTQEDVAKVFNQYISADQQLQVLTSKILFLYHIIL